MQFGVFQNMLKYCECKNCFFQVQQLEGRFKAIEGALKKQKEVNKDLLNEKIYLKESLKVQKEDAGTRKREMETLLMRTCAVKKEKAELQLVIDEKEKEAAPFKRQVTKLTG